jgi:hypothetical protein
MRKLNECNIYLELDTLVDTRARLLFEIDEDGFNKALKTGKYHNRLSDSIGGVSANVFNMIYAKRNKKLLTNALHTPMMDLVGDLYVENLNDYSYSGESGLVTIYLNIFPYRLNQEEIDNLRDGMVRSISEHATVEVVNMDPSTEVTPEWVSKTVGYLIMYDGFDWVNRAIMFNKFEGYKCPSVVLLTPLRTYGSDYEKLDENEITKGMLAMRDGVSDKIRLEFLKIYTMSFGIAKRAE